MSWGALNNQRERTSTEPLPEFLTGQGGKAFHDRTDPQFRNVEDVVVQKPERSNYTSRQEASRGYGVMYPGSVNIQVSKKTLFVSMIFFAIIVLATFCVGYAVGNLSISMSVGQTEATAPIRKPIIPVRKKVKPELGAMKKNVEEVVSVEAASAVGYESDTPSSLKKNNNKENDSETIDDAPQAAADTNEAVD